MLDIINRRKFLHRRANRDDRRVAKLFDLHEEASFIRIYVHDDERETFVIRYNLFNSFNLEKLVTIKSKSIRAKLKRLHNRKMRRAKECRSESIRLKGDMNVVSGERLVQMKKAYEYDGNMTLDCGKHYFVCRDS